jgi:type III secretion system regulator LcrR
MNTMDILTKYFIKNNIKVTDYYWNNTSLWLGNRIEHYDKEIIYRIEQDTIILVIYRRTSKKINNLQNPFKSFIWLVETIAYNIPDIRYIKGQVDALTLNNDNVLSSARLINYYCRIMGGIIDGSLLSGYLWFDLRKYKPMKQRKQLGLIEKKINLLQAKVCPRSYK